ncbi:MAG: hypothetical protein E7419_06855 [Ruminococcaceae bacterium]|nr:hypothetical protein [Oscillospiraceae bacterium]
MKKTVVGLIILILSVLFIGCEENNIENAVWEKYESESFLEYLQVGVEGMYYFDDYNKIDKVIVRYETGWNDFDSLNNGKHSKNKEAYTYVVDVYKSNKIAYDYKFFAEYDKKTNRLKVKGGLSSEYFGNCDNKTKINQYEANLFLGKLYQYQ